MILIVRKILYSTVCQLETQLNPEIVFYEEYERKKQDFVGGITGPIYRY